MKRLWGAWIALALMVSASSALWAAEPNGPCALEPASEPVEIYVITMGPGPDLFSQFGHAAIYVRGAEVTDRLYNFGMYDESDPDLMIGFLEGTQPFYVSRGTYRWMLLDYSGQGRDIYAQRLELPMPQLRWLAAELEAISAGPDNTYIYHWYTANCTTRIRDLIDDAMGGALAQQHTLRLGLTPRGEVLRLIARRAEAWFGIHLIFGPEMDEAMTRWDAMFLPRHLREGLAASTQPAPEGAARIPVVGATCQLNRGTLPAPPEEGPRRDLWMAVLGFGLAALTLGLGLLAGRSAVARVGLGAWLALLGLVMGALGGLASAMWFASEMGVSSWNANLFLVSPLSAALLPAGALVAWGRRGALRWAHHLVAALAALALVGLMLVGVDALAGGGQDSAAFFGLVLPPLLALERAVDYVAVTRRGSGPGGSR